MLFLVKLYVQVYAIPGHPNTMTFSLVAVITVKSRRRPRYGYHNNITIIYFAVMSRRATNDIVFIFEDSE